MKDTKRMSYCEPLTSAAKWLEQVKVPFEMLHQWSKAGVVSLLFSQENMKPFPPLSFNVLD